MFNKIFATIFLVSTFLAAQVYAEPDVRFARLVCSNGDRTVFIDDDTEEGPAVWFRAGSLPFVEDWRHGRFGQQPYTRADIDHFEDALDTRIVGSNGVGNDTTGVASAIKTATDSFHDNPMDVEGNYERRDVDTESLVTELQVKVPYQWNIGFPGGPFSDPSTLSTRTVNITGHDGKPRQRTFATIKYANGYVAWDSVPCFYLTFLD